MGNIVLSRYRGFLRGSCSLRSHEFLVGVFGCTRRGFLAGIFGPILVYLLVT